MFVCLLYVYCNSLFLCCMLTLDRCEALSLIVPLTFTTTLFHSSSLLPPNAQLNLNSAHIVRWIPYIVPNFLRPPSTHQQLSSFSILYSLPFFCNLSIIAPLLFWNTSSSFSCLLFFCHSSIHPSSLLFFFLFVQPWVSVKEAQRVGMAAWHKHTRLPISPLEYPIGGLGNLLFTVHPSTSHAFSLFSSNLSSMLFLNLFYKYSPAVLGVNIGSNL